MSFSQRNFSKKPPNKGGIDTSRYEDLIKQFVEKNSPPPEEPNQVEYTFPVEETKSGNQEKKLEEKSHKPRLKDKFSGIPNL